MSVPAASALGLATRIAVIGLMLGACRAGTGESEARYASDCDDAHAGVLSQAPAAAEYLWKVGAGDRDEYLFGWLTDVAVDHAGRVYAIDSFAKRVMVYDSTGRFLRSFGRRGQGPGEFENPIRVAVRGGGVTVFDANLWRLTSFDTLGHLLASRSPPAQPQFGQRDEVAFDTSGALFNLGYQNFQQSLEAGRGEGARGVLRGVNLIQRWDTSAGGWSDLAEVLGREVYVNFGTGELVDVRFPRRALWVPAHEGFWYADSGSGEIHRYTADGDVRCTLRLAVRGPAVSRRERSLYRSAADVRDPTPERLARARRLRREIPLPRTKPPLDALALSDKGDLWVKMTPADPDTPSALWHVFTSDAELRGSVLLPRGLRPRVIHDGRVVGIELDSLGVHHVAVLTYR